MCHPTDNQRCYLHEGESHDFVVSLQIADLQVSNCTPAGIFALHPEHSGHVSGVKQVHYVHGPQSLLVDLAISPQVGETVVQDLLKAEGTLKEM